MARLLLETEAVLVRPDKPFTLTSGELSPLYVDCRRLLAFPKERREILGLARDFLCERIENAGSYVLVGGESAGIPFAAWLAAALDAPMAYVRKKPKGFGRMAMLEGAVPERAEGRRAVLVEDLLSEGGSKIHFLEALKRAGFKVAHVFVIFDYGVFDAARMLRRSFGVSLHALTGWRYVLEEAEACGALTPECLREARAFLCDPGGWRAGRA